MGFRRFHKVLHTAFALGYLLLGLAAAWHAPHFSEARSSIGADRHAEHEAVLGDDCALCTVKTSPQLDVVRFRHGLAVSCARAPLAAADAFAAATRAFVGRPRAPPALLS